MSTLPAPIPSICSIGLLDGFPCYRTGEFIMFSICSTKDRTLPSCAASAASDPQSRALQLSYSSIFVAFFNKKLPHHGICTTKHTKQKDVSIFRKDVSHRACKKYVYAEFWSRTCKSTGIGECTSVPRNYSISELKRCRI